MRDDLPRLLFNPDVVRAVSGLVNKATLSYLIAGAVLSQFSRRGLPGAERRDFVIPSEYIAQATAWLSSIKSFVEAWSVGIADFFADNFGRGLVNDDLRIMLEYADIPAQTRVDVVDVCDQLQRLIENGVPTHSENTMFLEHFFAAVRERAGRQGMTASSSFSIIGKLKVKHLVQPIDGIMAHKVSDYGRMPTSMASPKPVETPLPALGMSTLESEESLDDDFATWLRELESLQGGDWLQQCDGALDNALAEALVAAEDDWVVSSETARVLQDLVYAPAARGAHVANELRRIHFLFNKGSSAPKDWVPEECVKRVLNSSWLFSHFKRLVTLIQPDSPPQPDACRNGLRLVVHTLCREITTDTGRTIASLGSQFDHGKKKFSGRQKTLHAEGPSVKVSSVMTCLRRDRGNRAQLPTNPTTARKDQSRASRLRSIMRQLDLDA